MLSSGVMRSPIHLLHRSSFIRACTGATFRIDTTEVKAIPTRTSTVFKTDLPHVYSPPMYFQKSLKGLHQIKLDKVGKTAKHRSRKYGRQLINQLMIGLTMPLTEILKSYKKCFQKLNSFEQVVCELTLISLTKKGSRELQAILNSVRELRAHTSVVGKYYIKRASAINTTAEAQANVAEAKAALGSIFGASVETLSIAQDKASRGEKGDRWQAMASERVLRTSGAVAVNRNDSKNKDSNISEDLMTTLEEKDLALSTTRPQPLTHLSECLRELIEVQMALRRVPEIDLLVPTIVLVGAPNVGKSSIVRRVSSGAPEVADYPFTTRGLAIGHIVDASQDWRVQVMDTPGLLDRPAADRNEMERLTYSSLANLPTAVMFVLDATGLSGEKSTLDKQLRIRDSLKERFPKRPWIDVVSKADIDLCGEVLAKLPEDSLHVSSKTGHQMDELRRRIDEKIHELLQAVETLHSHHTTTTTTTSDDDDSSSSDADGCEDEEDVPVAESE